MRDLVYFSGRQVARYKTARAGGQVRRRLGLWRFVPARLAPSVGIGPIQVNIDPPQRNDPRRMHVEYDRLRRAMRRRLVRFPNERISTVGHPYIEFSLSARWGYMCFLGLGVTPNPVRVDGRSRHNVVTFWLRGTAPDGSILILVGSADNLLSTVEGAFTDAGMRLYAAFNYPSASEGLTALIEAVNPQMKLRLPRDERQDLRKRTEADIAGFALSVCARADGDDDDYADADDDEPDGVALYDWVIGDTSVEGLAQVYASADGAEVKDVYPDLDWLPDSARVVVGAPYAIYRT